MIQENLNQVNLSQAKNLGKAFLTQKKAIQTIASHLSSYREVSRLDRELLLSHILRCSRSDLYIRYDQKLSQKQNRQFLTLLGMRKAGWPIAYIIQKKEFYGYEFVIQPGVFIPRPETETLVSAVLSQYKKWEKLSLMDFGSGSGCVGLSLLALMPRARLIALDLSEKALKISKINATKLRVMDRVVFLKRDLLKWRPANEKNKIGKIDVILANPPYIAFNDHRVQKEVVAFEPAQALFSGEGGFFHIRSYLSLAEQILKPGGHYFFEIGAGQDISFLALKKKMQKVKEFQDMSYITRVVQVRKSNG